MDESRIIEFLKNNKKSFVTDVELRQLYEGDNDYKQVAEFIDSLVRKGKLTHTKKEATNGMNPPMFRKYKLVKEKEDYKEFIEEIMLLNHNLSRSYYLEKVKEYIKHREDIEILSKYFWYHEDRLKIPMSVNERSYDIWGKEKFLKGSKAKDGGEDNGLGKTILKNLKVTYEMLNIYDTPEPFFYYINDRSSNNVLIIENKDTWYTIRKLLKEGQNEIFGFSIGLLIYGEGKKIKKSIGFINDEELSFISKPVIKYWGDIDYTGIDIFYSLKEEIDVELFIPAYEFMVDRVGDIDCLQNMKDQRERKHTEEFLSSFNEKYRDIIANVLNKNKYIPQEINNYQMMAMWEKV